MIQPRNRVVQLMRFGGPEALQVMDAPLPTAGRGEVRIRMLASSIEYTDVTIRRHVIRGCVGGHLLSWAMVLSEKSISLAMA